MKITLVRHGQTEWNVERRIQWHIDTILNDTWRYQADCVAKYLEHKKFDYIISSDLKRVSTTARKIAAYHPNSIYVEDKRVREKELWIFQWVKIDDIYSEYGLNDRNWYYDFVDSHHSVETRIDIAKRVNQCVNEVILSWNKNICIVGHWWSLKLVRSSLLWIYDNDVKIKNCSISTYELVHNKRNELVLGSINHLE